MSLVATNGSKQQPRQPVGVQDLAVFQARQTSFERVGAFGFTALNLSNENGRPVVHIRVADRGPGIPKDEQGQVFDPFFRGKRALQDQIHGTGLGLSLVKDIIEAHGGSIALHSEPGKGTEFVARIPAAPQEYQDELSHSAGRG